MRRPPCMDRCYAGRLKLDRRHMLTGPFVENIEAQHKPHRNSGHTDQDGW